MITVVKICAISMLTMIIQIPKRIETYKIPTKFS